MVFEKVSFSTGLPCSLQRKKSEAWDDLQERGVGASSICGRHLFLGKPSKMKHCMFSEPRSDAGCEQHHPFRMRRSIMFLHLCVVACRGIATGWSR